MDLLTCLRRLGEEGRHEALAYGWEDSVATLPAGPVDFLRAANLREWRKYCRLDASAEPDLLRAAERIEADPALRLVAWHCFRRLYVHTESGGFEGWPDFEGALGELAGLPYLIVGLAMVPAARETHRRLGVPPGVARDTCREVTSFANNYHDFHEGRRWGLLIGQLFWLRHYPAGRLFRIGRFEHMLQPFRGGVSVWRHRVTREVVALAEGGQRFDREGYHPYPGEDDPEGFTTTFVEREGAVTGHPVSPAGHAVREVVSLATGEWDRVLAPGDTMLDMHIPSGGGMGPETCERSLKDALGFFARTFPDRPALGFQCSSWIYNPQLEGMLGPDANLVKHLRQVHLTPCHSSGRDGVYFLFYTEDVDPATARRDTSIRRAFLDHLAQGKRLRSSSMFLLAEEVARYGEEPYLSQAPPIGVPTTEWSPRP